MWQALALRTFFAWQLRRVDDSPGWRLRVGHEGDGQALRALIVAAYSPASKGVLKDAREGEAKNPCGHSTSQGVERIVP